MTTTTRDLLATFERLSKPEQCELASEILKRFRDLENPPIDEEELVRIADERFQKYDSREATDVHPASS